MHSTHLTSALIAALFVGLLPIATQAAPRSMAERTAFVRHNATNATGTPGGGVWTQPNTNALWNCTVASLPFGFGLGQRHPKEIAQSAAVCAEPVTKYSHKIATTRPSCVSRSWVARSAAI